jgi:hypothetical protein
MTTAYTNIRVETIKSEGQAFDFWVCANRGSDRVILARVNWQSGSLCHPWTETEAKCWADLFADALPLKRENDKLRQELAERGWQPIETAPVVGLFLATWKDRKVNAHKLSVCQFSRGYIVTAPGEYVVHPTHWQPLPTPPLCATRGNSLPAEVRV